MTDDPNGAKLFQWCKAVECVYGFCPLFVSHAKNLAIMAPDIPRLSFITVALAAQAAGLPGLLNQCNDDVPNLFRCQPVAFLS
eukprot:3486666-Amphidinium_carterae.1